MNKKEIVSGGTDIFPWRGTQGREGTLGPENALQNTSILQTIRSLRRMIWNPWSRQKMSKEQRQYYAAS